MNRIKVNDIFLSLLKDYHGIEASEALSFFNQSANNMLEVEPNITKASRTVCTAFDKAAKRTELMPTDFFNLTDKKIYVLRGFYPATSIPFKMSLVVVANPLLGSDNSFIKVSLGNKDHFSYIDSTEIDKYNNAVSESILLNQVTPNDIKIKYKYRNFKCMRPRGLPLFKKGKAP